MKTTGIVRKVDELGRIVLPVEIRRVFDIQIRDTLEIYTEGDKILLKKYDPACVFCGRTENIISFKGKLICANCFDEMKAL